MRATVYLTFVFAVVAGAFPCWAGSSSSSDSSITFYGRGKGPITIVAPDKTTREAEKSELTLPNTAAGGDGAGIEPTLPERTPPPPRSAEQAEEAKGPEGGAIGNPKKEKTPEATPQSRAGKADVAKADAAAKAKADAATAKAKADAAAAKAEADEATQVRKTKSGEVKTPSWMKKQRGAPPEDGETAP